MAIDTDKDGIPDCYEKEVLKTDPNRPDTDGDGLPDGYEIFTTGSDPLKKDSDLDNDEDDLSNLEEYQLKTDPNSEDSDNDKINDYEEVKKYYTNPNELDTDKDGIYDGNELQLGFNPTKKDTDGNGIEDGKEKTEQTFQKAFDYDEEDYQGLTSITIKGKFTNYIDITTEVSNAYESDIFSSNIVGLVGVPLEIETKSEFDKATVSISYQTLPNNIKAENLGILWYNETENQYEVIESTTNQKEKKVTFETTHFSTYLLVDLKQWYNIWDNPINYGNPKKAVGACDTAYVVDVSKSMNNADFKKVRNAMKDLTDTMITGEKGALIGYQISSCTLLQELTGKKKTLKKAIDKMKPEKKMLMKNSGVTNEGIRKGIAQLKKGKDSNGRMLFVIGDADISYDESLIKQAKKEHIQVFVVNVNGKNALKQLKKYASETGGFYYTLEDMQYLQGLLFDIKHIILDGIDTTDTDDDGLFDIYETKGLRGPNGVVFYSDPNKKDTDGDGLTDLEETGYPIWIKKEIAKGSSIKFYRNNLPIHSNSKLEDTDGDGILDTLDINMSIILGKA